ncbi:MAG: hypothetical protein AAF492_32055, partial [Verrucomicrobiota bacterium]
ARSADWAWATWFNMASNGLFNCYDPVHQQVAELAVTKTASSTNLLLGSNLTYTIDVMNSSTVSVGTLRVIDLLPTQLVFESSTPAPTIVNNNRLLYFIPGFGGNASTSIVIQTRVDTAVPGIVTNRVIAVPAPFEVNTNDNLSLAPTTIPDSDGDGIANPGDPDDDNDGFSDDAETLANTDPFDPDSFLWVRIQQTGLQTVHTLTFPTALGRTYSLERSTNLFVGGWMQVRTNISGTGALLNLLDTNQAGRVYYRVGVRSP